MTTPFDHWWVGRYGRPPSGPEETTRAGEMRAAWEGAASDVVVRHNNLILRNGELERQRASAEEEVNVLRIQRREALTERDEAVRLSQRHEELRRQTERQCDRIRKLLQKIEDRAAAADRKGRTAVGANPPQRETIWDVVDEVVRARKKFPSREHLLAALGEEYGEVCRAYLENEGKERVYDEAKQVACVAIRIMEEGDSDFDDGSEDLDGALARAMHRVFELKARGAKVFRGQSDKGPR